MTCSHPVRERDERGKPYCGVCGAMLGAERTSDPSVVFSQ